jgi:hypothetical protein
MQKTLTRFLAVLLAVGGVIGIAIALFMGFTFVKQHWIYIVIVAAFAALFAYSTLVGYRLWKGDPVARKRALLLFASQVPVFTLPGVTYEWYTGLAFKIMGGQVEKTTVLSLGSSINLYLDTRITDVAYGVNIVALLAVGCLLAARSKLAATVAPRESTVQSS